MAITRADAIRQLGNSSSISNQQSLVQKLAGPKIQRQIKHIIPGGANLTETVSQENLPAAIFTWLRRVRHFKDVSVFMSSGNTNRKTTESTVVDFDTQTRQPQWEIQGKKWLAERIAEVLGMENVIGVKVTREGLGAVFDPDESLTPSSEDWEPHLLFTPIKPGA